MTDAAAGRRDARARARARRNDRFSRFGPARGVAGAIATTTVTVPMEMALRVVAGWKTARLPFLFHTGLARSLGIRITVHGRPARKRRVLFVANHVSWADIPVLGAKIRGNFVAKSEVGGWGPVGWLATFARTVYVDRQRRTSSGQQRDAIGERLARGENIILFPEGTNSDGVEVLPFKSALFAVGEGVPDVLIQPVTIAYTRVNGLPVSRQNLPDLAWVGDTELFPHAFAFMALGRVRAELIFHDAVRASDFPNRKALAKHCETVVSDGYRRLMRG